MAMNNVKEETFAGQDCQFYCGGYMKNASLMQFKHELASVQTEVAMYLDEVFENNELELLVSSESVLLSGLMIRKSNAHEAVF
jgi:hypothetical protein